MKIIGFDRVERSETHIRADITLQGFWRRHKRRVYAQRGSCMWRTLDTGEYVPGVHDAYEAWIARESFANPDPAREAEAALAAKEMKQCQANAAAAFFGVQKYY